MPKKLVYIFLSALFILLLFVLGFWFSYQVFLSSKVIDKYSISILPGTSRSQISRVFSPTEQNGIFHDLYIKTFYFLNKDITVEAGNYVFKKDTSYKDILAGFQDGSLLSKVTLLEGWRVEESALYLAKNVSPEFALNYYNAAKDYEGSLFPDTYFIDQNTPAESLVNLQLNTFKEKVGSSLNNNPDLSQDELLIFASILERETNGQDDLPLLAGILIKRYLEGMPLDADATAQYAKNILNEKILKDCIDSFCVIDFWPSQLTSEDLKNPSIYNTRGKVGLPPKPICNPSINSINAVVSPKTSQYYYYLHDKSGEAHYATTLEQHIENIQKYL